MKQESFVQFQEVLQTKHVTFVCAANTCRSPMAEGLLKEVLRRAPEPLHSLKVLSCGMNASDGAPAHADAIFALRETGIDISEHRSRNVTREIVARSLAIFTMRREYLYRMKLRYPDEMPADACVMRELMSAPGDEGVFDPYDDGLDAYIRCRNCMAEAIPSIVTFLSLKLMTLLFPNEETDALKDFSRRVYQMGRGLMTNYE
jgi:protein-tyrosine phosphatase